MDHPHIAVISKLYQWYAKVFGKNERTFKILMNLSVVIGLWTVLKLRSQFTLFLYRHFVKPFIKSKDWLYSKYGRKAVKSADRTWAVVTGGSDGIGLQIAKDLARQGFNICIIARNLDKMNDKIVEIKKCAAKPIDTKAVVMDFSKSLEIKDFRQMVQENLGDLDVGVLILNAGWGRTGPFEMVTDEDVQDTTSINVLHPIYLMKSLVN